MAGDLMKVMLVYPNVTKARTPQMGILSLGTYLLDKTIDTTVCDLTFIEPAKYLDHMTAEIAREKPDIVGFSCRTMEFPASKSLLIELRKKYQNILFIAGGPHATFKPGDLAQFVDYVVIGEGELAVFEIAKALADDKRKSISGINNIAYLKDGALVRNNMSPLLDISQLPIPSYGLFDERHYFSNSFLKIVPGAKICGTFEGSRGCPFSCTYCSNKALKGLYRGSGKWRREKPAAKLREEINAFKGDYGLDMMHFIDEVIMTTDNRTFELKENLQDLNVPFIFMERPELINENRAKNIKAAGAYSCSIGIESADEEFRLKLLRRKIADKNIRKAFTIMKKRGVKTHAFIIMGLPEQTKEIMHETYRLLQELQPDTAQATTFFPLPGTELDEYVREKDLIDKDFTIPHTYYGSSLLNYSSKHKYAINTVKNMINIGLYKKSLTNSILTKCCFKIPYFINVLCSLKQSGFKTTSQKVIKKLLGLSRMEEEATG
jgi:radical SAM superfamily enzyme YgiQ (UPF0313 family)